MINLMPQEIKTDRDFGRKNRSLIKWISLSLILFIVLLIFAGAGIMIMNKALANEKERKQILSASIASDKLDKAEKDYSDFVSDVKTVTQILSKQVLYSELLKQIGNITPQGANLTSISISSKDNALDLNFAIINADIAPVLQLNLQDEKNKLFEKADIIQVNCQPKESGSTTCTAQMRAEYKKDADFLFINTVGSK